MLDDEDEAYSDWCVNVGASFISFAGLVALHSTRLLERLAKHWDAINE